MGQGLGQRSEDGQHNRPLDQDRVVDHRLNQVGFAEIFIVETSLAVDRPFDTYELARRAAELG